LPCVTFYSSSRERVRGDVSNQRCALFTMGAAYDR
jgi:hypothetical protein